MPKQAVKTKPLTPKQVLARAKLLGREPTFRVCLKECGNPRVAAQARFLFRTVAKPESFGAPISS